MIMEMYALKWSWPILRNFFRNDWELSGEPVRSLEPDLSQHVQNTECGIDLTMMIQWSVPS